MDVLETIKKTKIVVAPMAGISDPPFRRLCRDFGAKLCYTEMISAAGVMLGDKKSKVFTFIKDEHPIVAQIFGSDPDAMQYAAKYFEEQGADIIDINLGCPVKKVAKQSSGAALARDLLLTEKTIQAVAKVINIPLSIKFRLGWSKNLENYLELCKIAQNSGVSLICLHSRYANQMYSGVSDWSKVNEMRKHFSGLIIGSGDINTPDDISQALDSYDVDAVMLGRGVWGNPWLISDYLKKDRLSLHETILRHFEYMSEFHGEKKAAILFRKFISKYIKGLPNSQKLRMMGNAVSTKSDLLDLLEELGGKCHVF